MSRKNIVIVMGVIFIFVVLSIYLVNHKSYYVDKYPKTIQDASYFTDARAQEMFTDKGIYNLTSLKGHEVYLIDKTMNIDFYYGKDATSSQIDISRSFALTTFVLKQSLFLGESPYMVLNNMENRDKWEKVSCKIYVNDKLKNEDNYDEKGILIK